MDVRRLDRLGIHSIGEFSITVPCLDDAREFYTAFGLSVRSVEPGRLEVGTSGTPHVWCRITQGSAFKFESLTLHCYEDEVEQLAWRAQTLGHTTTPHPETGFWIYGPDELLIHIKAGPKTTIDEAAHHSPGLPLDGIRCAPYRRDTKKVEPQRLSHIAFLSPDVPRCVEFCSDVLGLRLSDHSGDKLAFMHGPHGSDHHLIAFAHSDSFQLHHISWDVPTVEEVGLGYMQMRGAGYERGWGVGRHVLGSNYFYYAQDPWGGFCEYSATMDFIPSTVDWVAQDHLPEDGFYLWGPDVPPYFAKDQ